MPAFYSDRRQHQVKNPAFAKNLRDRKSGYPDHASSVLLILVLNPSSQSLNLKIQPLNPSVQHLNL